MKTVKVLLTSLMLATSMATLATEDAPKISGFYTGAGYGSFSYETDQNWDDDLFYGRLIEETEGDTLKVYAGYQFNRVVAIEATYTDYGDTQGYVRTLDFQSLSIKNENVQQSPSAISLAANVGYSFSSGLRPYLLAGVSYMTLDSSYPFLDTDNPMAFRYGLGFDYAPALFKGVQLRIAYEADMFFAEAYNGLGEDIEVDTFSVSSVYGGISYKF